MCSFFCEQKCIALRGKTFVIIALSNLPYRLVLRSDFSFLFMRVFKKFGTLLLSKNFSRRVSSNSLKSVERAISSNLQIFASIRPIAILVARNLKVSSWLHFNLIMLSWTLSYPRAEKSRRSNKSALINIFKLIFFSDARSSSSSRRELMYDLCVLYSAPATNRSILSIITVAHLMFLSWSAWETDLWISSRLIFFFFCVPFSESPASKHIGFSPIRASILMFAFDINFLIFSVYLNIRRHYQYLLGIYW